MIEKTEDATMARIAQRWRERFNLASRPTVAGLESLETEEVEHASPGGSAEACSERIARARQAMIQLVRDQLGGDSALLDEVQGLTLTCEEAINILAEDETTLPAADSFGAFEAIVAFDGTRPAFLIKDDHIDFGSSFNAASWPDDLEPYLQPLAEAAACVGRIELRGQHVGTAFMVTPTLAITNRHVAQGIARFYPTGGAALRSDAFLDFGRERNGRQSFDRRSVQAILFAGKDSIEGDLDHRKLDLAVLRVTPSNLGGTAATRHLSVQRDGSGAFDSASMVATIGYPAAPDNYVPGALKSKYDDLLRRLLEGAGGAKRFAPGVPTDFDGESGPAVWTVAHDAITINGNSGSPVFILDGATKSPRVLLSGLHYGGRWSGERVNWAHLMTATGPGVGCDGVTTFAQFCDEAGIQL